MKTAITYLYTTTRTTLHEREEKREWRKTYDPTYVSRRSRLTLSFHPSSHPSHSAFSAHTQGRTQYDVRASSHPDLRALGGFERMDDGWQANDGDVASVWEGKGRTRSISSKKSRRATMTRALSIFGGSRRHRNTIADFPGYPPEKVHRPDTEDIPAVPALPPIYRPDRHTVATIPALPPAYQTKRGSGRTESSTSTSTSGSVSTSILIDA